jgi:hypothetical protein
MITRAQLADIVLFDRTHKEVSIQMHNKLRILPFLISFI